MFEEPSTGRGDDDPGRDPAEQPPTRVRIMPGLRELQCQRTRFYLPIRIGEGEAVHCPWCPEHETYERLGPDHQKSRIVHQAMEMCREEFGVEEDGLGTTIWLGSGPETVLEAHLNRVNIYLGRRSNLLQVRYSGAHEAFHRVCSPCIGRHWADEMFAVLFSLLYLDRTGFEDHANLNRESDLLVEAPECTAEQMFALDGPCPPGLYGRAYVLGRDLHAAIGWDRLKILATTKLDNGRMDVAGWLASLTAAERARVEPLLQGAPELARQPTAC